MRTPAAFRMLVLSGVALLLLAAGASAQDGEGCTQEQPCVWFLDLERSGFSRDDGEGLDRTLALGDWLQIGFYNFDTVPHAVTLEGYEHTWVVEPGEEKETDPFELHTQGEFLLEDDPSGDAVALRVTLEGEDEDPAPGTQTEDGTTPGPIDGPPPEQSPAPAVLLLGGLLVGAAVLRRRR